MSKEGRHEFPHVGDSRLPFRIMPILSQDDSLFPATQHTYKSDSAEESIKTLALVCLVHRLYIGQKAIHT
jgi:hypothetical protein